MKTNVGKSIKTPIIQPKPIQVPSVPGKGDKPHDRPKTPMTGVTG